MSVRSEPTTRLAVLERAGEGVEALVDLAGADRVVRGLDDQPDARDALLRPVVQGQGEPAALAFLDAQQAVGEAAALALAQLGLDAQRLGEGEEARVVRGAHGGGGEHAQLRALDGAEGVVAGAQDGERAGLERRHGQRRDLDRTAVGRGELGGEIGGAPGLERRGAPGLAERGARDDGAAVAGAFEHEAAFGRDERERFLGDALEQAALVELVREPGRGGEQVVERVGLGAELLAQGALGLDVALGRAARAARAQGQHGEHAEGDRKQSVEDDLVCAHAGSTCPVWTFTTR